MPAQALIDQALQDAAEKALKISKITLMMGSATVFYTTILFSMKQVITTEIPTACTDGKTLMINPKFFTDLTPNERLTLLAHEVLHVALDHMHRIGDRDPKEWNIAGDYVINGSLIKAGYTMPDGGLYDEAYEGLSTVAVYNIIHGKTPEQKAALNGKCGSGAMNGNDVSYPDPSKSDQVTQDEVTEIILRATTQAKAMGQSPGAMPGEIDRELQRIINPPLPWHVILQNYLTEFAQDDYSFRRPNKRFLPYHYLPTAHSEAIANIAIAVDTSCSVTDHEFGVFISKIYEIQQALHPKKITVIAFDTKIKNVQELTDDDNPFQKLKFQGKGGTRISPVHDWAAENRPTLLLVFTDGEFTQTPPVNRSIPVIWVIHDKPEWKATHGRVITYNIDK